MKNTDEIIKKLKNKLNAIVISYQEWLVQQDEKSLAVIELSLIEEKTSLLRHMKKFEEQLLNAKEKNNYKKTPSIKNFEAFISEILEEINFFALDPKSAHEDVAMILHKEKEEQQTINEIEKLKKDILEKNKLIPIDKIIAFKLAYAANKDKPQFKSKSAKIAYENMIKIIENLEKETCYQKPLKEDLENLVKKLDRIRKEKCVLEEQNMTRCSKLNKIFLALKQQEDKETNKNIQLQAAKIVEMRRKEGSLPLGKELSGAKTQAFYSIMQQASTEIKEKNQRRNQEELQLESGKNTDQSKVLQQNHTLSFSTIYQLKQAERRIVVLSTSLELEKEASYASCSTKLLSLDRIIKEYQADIQTTSYLINMLKLSLLNKNVKDEEKGACVDKSKTSLDTMISEMLKLVMDFYYYEDIDEKNLERQDDQIVLSKASEKNEIEHLMELIFAEKSQEDNKIFNIKKRLILNMLSTIKRIFERMKQVCTEIKCFEDDIAPKSFAAYSASEEITEEHAAVISQSQHAIRHESESVLATFRSLIEVAEALREELNHNMPNTKKTQINAYCLFENKMNEKEGKEAEDIHINKRGL